MRRSLGLVSFLALGGIAAAEPTRPGMVGDPGRPGMIGEPPRPSAMAEPPRPSAVEPARSSAIAQLVDEVHGLRDEVATLRGRPDPATAADIDRLRGEVERLATAQRDLARRLEERLATPATDPPTDPAAGVPWLALAVGALAGWTGSALTQRRRDRRQRARLWW